jgi:hypothetical protein
MFLSLHQSLLNAFLNQKKKKQIMKLLDVTKKVRILYYICRWEEFVLYRKTLPDC